MKIVGRPTIANVSMTLADTEYSYSIPNGTSRFEIKLRALNALLKLAFESGKSGTEYITIPYGSSYAENDVKGGPITLYIQSPTAGMTLEIKTWK